jgi:hypothetical protein
MPLSFEWSPTGDFKDFGNDYSLVRLVMTQNANHNVSMIAHDALNNLSGHPDLLTEHILQRIQTTLRSEEIKSIEIHYLVPYGDEVIDKFLLSVRTGIDFGQGAELGV